MIKVKFLILFLCGFQASVFGQSVLSGANESLSVNRNITYKITSANDTLQLDLYTPQHQNISEKNPVVIFIHGGAWAQGNKDFERIYYMRTLRDSLVNNGYAVLSINYRLVNKNTHILSSVQDCKDAIRWVRAHADQYQIDTTNIGLWGGSAGAHLALLAAYTPDSLWRDDINLQHYSAKVNYVIDNFGPTDLNKVLRIDAGLAKRLFFKIFFKDLYTIRNKLIFAVTSYPVETEKENAIRTAEIFSPLQYISSEPVPTLILHGTKDRVVPISQSDSLAKLLSKKGIKNKFIKVAKGDHGFNNIPNEKIDELIQVTLSFISQHR